MAKTYRLWITIEECDDETEQYNDMGPMDGVEPVPAAESLCDHGAA